MKHRKIPVLLLLCIITLLCLAACGRTPDQYVKSFCDALVREDFASAASALDAAFVPEYAAPDISAAHYLQAVSDSLGPVQDYTIESTSENDAVDEYIVRTQRDNTEHTETLRVQDGRIVAYVPPAPDSTFINNLYTVIANKNQNGINRMFSPYLQGYAGEGTQFFHDIGSDLGTFEKFSLIASEYYYEDYPGAAMQACIRYCVFESRKDFDADVVVTAARTVNGLKASAIVYAPVAAAKTMDAIMQCYQADDYKTLETLYSIPYVSTVGGEFNIHLNEIVFPLEQRLGDITGYAIDGYTVFDLQAEDAQSMRAIRVDYTVDYEYGQTREQITLADDQGTLKIYIHYINET